MHAAFLEVGRELTDQKAQLGHGNFLNWIESEFEWSQPTAHRYMSVYETFGANYSQVNNLSFKALAALAAPSTPEPVHSAPLRFRVPLQFWKIAQLAQFCRLPG